MIKVLWCKFQQYYGPFTILLVNGSSEAGLFRHLPNDISGVHNFGNTKSMWAVFIFKKCKIRARFQKFRKRNKKKLFVFQIKSSELVLLNCLY